MSLVSVIYCAHCAFCQKCAADVLQRPSLRKLFDKSLHGLELQIDGGSAIVDAFYAIWTRKFMHARINEFFSSRGDRIATAKGQHSKGGHALCDTLFALSRRGPVKSLSMHGPANSKTRTNKPKQLISSARRSAAGSKTRKITEAAAGLPPSCNKPSPSPASTSHNAMHNRTRKVTEAAVSVLSSFNKPSSSPASTSHNAVTNVRSRATKRPVRLSDYFT